MCKNVIKYFADGTVPETLIAEVFNSSRVKVRVTPKGDVEMKDRDGDVEMKDPSPQDDCESQELTKAVAQLHVNLGHPSNDALARGIRLAGGTDAAIRTAMKLYCAVCNRLKEPSAIPAASLRKWKEFGECVAIDLFMLGDCGAESATFLNMVDMASRYQVVFPIADKNPITVFYGFLMGWCMTLGIPANTRFDVGGEFEAAFAEMAEQVERAEVSERIGLGLSPCTLGGGARGRMRTA